MAESTQTKVARLFRVVDQLDLVGRSEVLCYLCRELKDDQEFAFSLGKILFERFPAEYELGHLKGDANHA